MTDLPPPQVPTADEIRAAAQRIEKTVLRTFLIQLNGSAESDVWLNLGNLQLVNSFEIRGSMSAITALPHDERAPRVSTVSAGNAGHGVAYAAHHLRVPATVLTVETAPETKLERTRALWANVV